MSCFCEQKSETPDGKRITLGCLIVVWCKRFMFQSAVCSRL